MYVCMYVCTYVYKERDQYFLNVFLKILNKHTPVKKKYVTFYVSKSSESHNGKVKIA